MADDLRRARSAQTRTRLVETFCALAADGALHPTARQIAERAGCSVRSVFHHFHSLAVLIDEALAVQSARHRPLLAAIPARGDTAGRVAALCRQRRLYFEELLPLYRAAGAPAGTPGAAPVLADDRARMRQQLLATFGPELAAAGAVANTLLSFDEAIQKR